MQKKSRQETERRRLPAAAFVAIDWRRDPTVRWFIATALFLIAVELTFAATIGRGPVIVVLPWVAPTAESIGLLVALSIAYYGLGVYRVLRNPTALWVSLAFSSNAVFTVFYLLVFPGLIDGSSIVAADPNTFSWLFHLKWTGLAFFLLGAPVAQRMGLSEIDQNKALLLAILVVLLSMFVSVVTIWLGASLPPMLIDRQFTALNLQWVAVVSALFAIGSALSLGNYIRHRTVFLGHIAILQLVATFILASDLFGGRVFDVVWYFNRFLLVASYSSVLQALLAEGVALLGLKDVFATEAQRRATELEATISSITDAVFVADKNGRIVEVNDAGVRLAGVPTKEELFRPVSDYVRLFKLTHLDGRPMAPEELALSRALRGEVVRGQEEILHDPRTRRAIYLLASGAPIRDEEGNIVGAVAVLSDITRIKELDKLKDEFISVAAHELKTPVTVIKGYAQMLLRAREGIGAEHRKALEAVDRGTTRIDRLVADLLDMSRLQIGRVELHKEKLDLTELVSAVVSRLAAKTTKHRLLFERIGPIPVEGDRARLEQVVANLLDNAIKYSPQGGDVEIKATVEAGQAVVSMKDHGLGIPKEKQPHIFERFYRAHAGTPYDFGGMGVGLFLSREIVSAHGGRMWFDSEEGKGSAFYFSLPLATLP